MAAQASWNDEARERSGNSRLLWLGKSLLRPWIQLMYYEKEYQAEVSVLHNTVYLKLLGLNFRLLEMHPLVHLGRFSRTVTEEAGFRELLTSRSGRSPHLRSAQPFVIFKSGNFTQRKLLHPIGDKQLQTSLYQPLTFRGFLSQGVRALTLSTNF